MNILINSAQKRLNNSEMKTPKITKSDFYFKFTGAGHYKVTYTSPVTVKSWTKLITDMSLIDLTKNEDEPRKKDLEHLKRIVKQ